MQTKTASAMICSATPASRPFIGAGEDVNHRGRIAAGAPRAAKPCHCGGAWRIPPAAVSGRVFAAVAGLHIGDRGMVLAIRLAGQCLGHAEAEIRRPRLTERPAAAAGGGPRKGPDGRRWRQGVPGCSSRRSRRGLPRGAGGGRRAARLDDRRAVGALRPRDGSDLAGHRDSADGPCRRRRSWRCPSAGRSRPSNDPRPRTHGAGRLRLRPVHVSLPTATYHMSPPTTYGMISRGRATSSGRGSARKSVENIVEKVGKTCTRKYLRLSAGMDREAQRSGTAIRPVMGRCSKTIEDQPLPDPETRTVRKRTLSPASTSPAGSGHARCRARAGCRPAVHAPWHRPH